MREDKPKIELDEYIDEEGNFTIEGSRKLEEHYDSYYKKYEERHQSDLESLDSIVSEINGLIASKPDGYSKKIEEIVSSRQYALHAAHFNSLRDFRSSSAINSIEQSAGITPTIYEIVESVDQYNDLKMMTVHCFRRIQLLRSQDDILYFFDRLMKKKVSVFYMIQSLRDAKLGDKGYVLCRLGDLYEIYGMNYEADIMRSLSQKDYNSTEPSYSFASQKGKDCYEGTKICFVSCVNNFEMYEECLFYISNLVVPNGVQVSTVHVSEASSMASGYNEAVRSVEADIYIFLHQDVSIINPLFLEDILGIFSSDEKIGIIGMVGSPKLPPDGVMWHGIRVGNLYSDETVLNFGDSIEDRFLGIRDVEAVDGLLIATSKGIKFREDIFDGWDFYDASICEEYRKEGFRVVVPDQPVPWVIHDDGYMNLYSYGKYRKIFLEEYYGKESN